MFSRTDGATRHVKGTDSASARSASQWPRYGLFDAGGNLAILAGHNNDLANFWDWYGDGTMPLKPSTDAFRPGANAVIYSMTH